MTVHEFIANQPADPVLYAQGATLKIAIMLNSKSSCEWAYLGQWFHYSQRSVTREGKSLRVVCMDFAVGQQCAHGWGDGAARATSVRLFWGAACYFCLDLVHIKVIQADSRPNVCLA